MEVGAETDHKLVEGVEPVLDGPVSRLKRKLLKKGFLRTRWRKI